MGKKAKWEAQWKTRYFIFALESLRTISRKKESKRNGKRKEGRKDVKPLTKDLEDRAVICARKSNRWRTG